MNDVKLQELLIAFRWAIDNCDNPETACTLAAKFLDDYHKTWLEGVKW